MDLRTFVEVIAFRGVDEAVVSEATHSAALEAETSSSELDFLDERTRDTTKSQRKDLALGWSARMRCCASYCRKWSPRHKCINIPHFSMFPDAFGIK